MNIQVGVKIIAKNKEGQVLVLRGTEEIHHGGKEVWDIPGGRIDFEEELLEALGREFEEEARLRLVGTPRLIGAQDIIVKEKGVHVVRLTYEGKVEGEVQLSHEHDKFSWVEKNELAVVAGLDRYVQELINESH